MESSKNYNNNNGKEEQQQLRRSAQKRKFNELSNDGDKPEEDQPEPEECSSSKKNREEDMNDLDLELESLSRDELIKLVRKQMEAAKKQDDESQHKVKELTSEMAKLNAEYQKLLEIVQLPHEKEEEIADDAEKQAALSIQPKPMKIQLSLETWYDWLAFVPRHRLGKIIPMIGDRKFASIVQKFLHEYGEITIDCIQIVAPYDDDPSGHPRVRKWQNIRPLKFKMAVVQMPANIKNFDIDLSYFDRSVLNFMQKFQQNGLLDKVNLSFSFYLSKDKIQQVLCHLLPLINGIESIEVDYSAQLIDIYDAANSKEIYEMNMKMMEETRILHINYHHEILHAKTIDLYFRWLYQTARDDGKPRVLRFEIESNMDEIESNMDFAAISLFINRIKKDFHMATYPVSFFIRIKLPKAFQSLEGICLENDKTKERLMTKMEEEDLEDWEGVVLLISRCPLASTKKWIEENEKEVLNMNFCAENGRTIYLSEELKVVPI